jgi:hypothetical protein
MVFRTGLRTKKKGEKGGYGVRIVDLKTGEGVNVPIKITQVMEYGSHPKDYDPQNYAGIDDDGSLYFSVPMGYDKNGQPLHEKEIFYKLEKLSP